ncbi:serine hydrolase domain-containing protein [Photobacterium kagoshimensis]|uniref:serine hydrolase domain-containing protein n=1 Tax=Photobacterium kagoshimensis TaxID=2910242 RepID=UPI003D0CF1C0
MKKTIVAVAVALTTAFSAQAATLHAPDQDYIASTAAWGIGQSNWDSGANNKLTYQNAYKYTSNMEMGKGAWTLELGKASGFDIDTVKVHDVDGTELTLTEMLRDRLNYESVVVLKNGKLITESYWNGMHKDKLHLMMSSTKSLVSMTLQTLVMEGKIDMDALVTKYIPELKDSGFGDATVQEIADMRSGVKIEFTPGLIWDEREMHIVEWNGENKYPEHPDMLSMLETLGQRDDVKTGQAFDYQGVNTEVLGELITRASGKNGVDAIEERIWKRIGVENNGRMITNKKGLAAFDGGMNATTRDFAILMDVLMNEGKNRKGEQIVPKSFIDNLIAGNEEVKSAWQYDGFSALIPTAWYKDQIRVLNYEGLTYLVFVGINGQVTIGEPKTGIVIGLNGAQPEMQAARTVGMTMMEVAPKLLKAIAAAK